MSENWRWSVGKRQFINCRNGLIGNMEFLSTTSLANEFKIEQSLNERLKATYQILTKIDKINHKVIVSVQFPDDNPNVEIKFKKSTHYNW